MTSGTVSTAMPQLTGMAAAPHIGRGDPFRSMAVSAMNIHGRDARATGSTGGTPVLRGGAFSGVRGLASALATGGLPPLGLVRLTGPPWSDGEEAASCQYGKLRQAEALQKTQDAKRA